MCITFNMNGSEKELLKRLKKHRIKEFQNIDGIVAFQNCYQAIRNNIIADHEKSLDQEKKQLHAEISQLEYKISALEQQEARRLREKIEKLKQQVLMLQELRPQTSWKKLINSLKLWFYKQQFSYLEGNFDSLIVKAVRNPIRASLKLKKRQQFLTLHFEKAVLKSSRKALAQLDHKKSVIDKLSTLIYGALGEVKVEQTLQALPDSYYLINDYFLSFSPPIYNRQEQDYIKSVQIDHVLVGPTGLFLIETKNWSENSLEQRDLRSPVQQVRRTSYALYRLLNQGFKKHHLRLDGHHWGDRKIPLKSLVVFIGPKPNEEFQFVKILGINELLRFIKNSSSSFSEKDIKLIADFLIQTNGLIIKTK